MKKTNAARILDKLKVTYEIKEYEVDEEDLGAENVSTKVGFPLQQTFKTLVLKGDKGGVLVALIPGASQLNLKALASTSDNKKVEMAPTKEIFKLTGYIRGGVSPIGMKKNYPTYIHESILVYDAIMVSAGVRGAQLIIKPDDLFKAIQGKICNIIVS